MSRPRLTEAAAADYVEAVNWYEAERKGAGIRFTLYVESALDRIEARPEAFPVAWSDFRRILLKVFPYTMIYRVEAGQVVVHAVFHTSQDPSRLRGRLGRA